jgi:hypothetical protein
MYEDLDMARPHVDPTHLKVPRFYHIRLFCLTALATTAVFVLSISMHQSINTEEAGLMYTDHLSVLAEPSQAFWHLLTQKQGIQKCDVFRPQLDFDFDHDDIFDEASVVAALPIVRDEKFALMHVNASGLFFVLQSSLDRHAMKCLRGFLVTFRPMLESNLVPLLLSKQDSISVLLNFNASSSSDSITSRFPIFSYAKTRNSKDILMPRPYLNRFWRKSPPSKIWNIFSQSKVAYFRGSFTNPLRAELAVYGQKNQDILDVGITEIIPDFPFNNGAPHFDLVSGIPMDDQPRKFKYIINVDGWGCADRMPYLMRLGAVVLYHGASNEDSNECVEWYHSGLKAGENFVKFNPDLSDLREKIEWLRSNDNKADAIIENANNFSNEKVVSDCTNWYMWEVIKRYHRIYRPSGSRTDAEQWLGHKSMTRVVTMTETWHLKH